MKSTNSNALGEVNNEVSVLMKTLLETGQRLEELTLGQVDTIADPEGRTLLLRGTHAQLRQREAQRQTAILNGLPVQVALLDGRGLIISVNDAWTSVDSANIVKGAVFAPGFNYLDICDGAKGLGSSDAHLAAEGIRSVLARKRKSFSIEYPCHSPTEKRWFLMTVTPFADDPSSGAIVMQMNTTERRNAESGNRLLSERLSLAAEVAKVGVWDWDVTTNTATWDSTMFEMYGIPPINPFLYEKWSTAVHPEDLDAAEATLRRVIDQKQQESMEFRIIKPNGAIRHISAVEGVILDSNGKVSRVIGVNMDITERKEAEEELFKEKERALVTLNSIGEAVICTDLEGNVTFLNPVAEEKTGWSSHEARKRPVADVLKIVNSETREITPGSMESAVVQNRITHQRSDCILVRRDGLEIPIEDSAAPIHARDGKITGAVIVFRDVSSARMMAREMIHAAEHDFLTGLPNRILLNDRVNQAIALASRHGKKVAVLFMDLDGFKHINDSLGHATGDKLLQSVTRRLVECVRGSDTVSRQGGDEFVVLLAEVERAEDAAITARRMLQKIAETHSIDHRDLHVTASIGVSVYPDDGLDVEALVKNADTAMYQAKESGRRSYQFFEPAMNVRAVDRQSIEEDLRCALERQEFHLQYQPIINLDSREITGAEALIRWTHPIRGLVSPAKFIPVAEESGLIVPIGNWVLREACKQARSWMDAGLQFTTVSVNISAMEFRNEHFLEGVFAALGESGLNPSHLNIELTESVLMKQADRAQTILKALRASGVRVAVDDFGTGYSSLSYLTKFPIDSLKIDQSFVRQLSTSPEHATIVSAIIGMGRSLNLRVVAEGVETHEELEFLKGHKCDESQGYYFSRPTSPFQFAELLEKGIAKSDCLDSSRP
jgi:diguanylate cyclase (GGDEF)-like protein/PAS domain S-box-containing protein